MATSGGKFDTYVGTTYANPMSGATFQAMEQRDTNWTAANGLGSVLTLTD